MKQQLIKHWWGAGVLLVAMHGALAQPIEYQFTATVAAVADDQGVLPAGLGIGTTLQGTFSWDASASTLIDLGSTVRYQDPANNTDRIFLHDTGLSFSIQAAGTASSPSGHFVVANDVADRFDRLADGTALTYNGFTGTPTGFIMFQLSLSGPATVFSTTAIPAGLDFADFTGSKFIEFQADDGGQVSGFTANLTSLTPVPEPATGWLLALGALGGWWAHRRFRRR